MWIGWDEMGKGKEGRIGKEGKSSELHVIHDSQR
jgi:hypothetical protein